MPAFAQRIPQRGEAPADGPRFGPFHGAFRLGTATRAGQLTIEPSAGVLPDHATVTLYATGVFGLEPAPGAPVWLAVQGRSPLYPITSAVQVNPGDHVVLGAQSGPRFVLSIDADVGRAATAAPPGGPGRAARGASPAPRPGLAGAVGNEMVRQGTVRLLTRAGPIRELYSLFNRTRTGSLTNPTMLVSILFAVAAAVAAGTVSCSGLLSLIWWKLTGH